MLISVANIYESGNIYGNIYGNISDQWFIALIYTL